jgi:hypothetical protein
VPPYGFKTSRQQRFMFARHPDIALRMAREAKGRGLPVVREPQVKAPLALTRSLRRRG